MTFETLLNGLFVGYQLSDLFSSFSVRQTHNSHPSATNKVKLVVHLLIVMVVAIAVAMAIVTVASLSHESKTWVSALVGKVNCHEVDHYHLIDQYHSLFHPLYYRSSYHFRWLHRILVCLQNHRI